MWLKLLLLPYSSLSSLLRKQCCWQSWDGASLISEIQMSSNSCSFRTSRAMFPLKFWAVRNSGLVNLRMSLAFTSSSCSSRTISDSSGLRGGSLEMSDISSTCCRGSSGSCSLMRRLDLRLSEVWAGEGLLILSGGGSSSKTSSTLCCGILRGCCFLGVSQRCSLAFSDCSVGSGTWLKR